MISDLRQNCEIDHFIADVVTFCQAECQPQKVMSRVAVNMAQIGQSYRDLLQAVYEYDNTKNMQEELKKLQTIGHRSGKIVREAVGFNRLDRLKSDFGKYLIDESDDEDF